MDGDGKRCGGCKTSDGEEARAGDETTRAGGREVGAQDEREEELAVRQCEPGG